MEWDQLSRAVGGRIRRYRKDAKLSIERLAEAADVGAVYLGSVERGAENPSLKILSAVAEALGVSVATLVDIDDDLSARIAKREALARIKRATPEQVRQALRVLDALR